MPLQTRQKSTRYGNLAKKKYEAEQPQQSNSFDARSSAGTKQTSCKLHFFPCLFFD